MRNAAAILLFCLTASTPAFAWGFEGHQIIAHIAARELTPAARGQLEQLLGGEAEAAMVQFSTWADEIRPQRPETAPWHFVNIPVGSAGYDRQRDCRRDDCVVEQIEREQRIVGDTTLLPAVRTEGLRFLIHFVGDLHQPLHAIDNHDRGGNDVRVTLSGRRTNLHAVWDTDVVRVLGRNAASVASELERSIATTQRSTWQTGTAAEWATETFRLAGIEIYSNPTGYGGAVPLVLPNAYPEQESTVTRVQLQKAGVRLAWTLNHALTAN